MDSYFFRVNYKHYYGERDVGSSPIDGVIGKHTFSFCFVELNEKEVTDGTNNGNASKVIVCNG